MELIAAVLIAGLLGYLVQPARRARIAYLALWATIFPIQTVVVFSTSSDGNALYWVFNAIILSLGVGLNAAGARLRVRRLAATR
jgi:peptidoglycan/LPS O-acetylase OafA/YrhL